MSNGHYDIIIIGSGAGWRIEEAGAETTQQASINNEL